VDWDIRLTRPVRTGSGDLRPELSTLGDALDMIDEDLSDLVRGKPHWQQARLKLIAAAQSGAQADIDDATAEVMVALSIEGKLEALR
jgi:hypothetical protein